MSTIKNVLNWNFSKPKVILSVTKTPTPKQYCRKSSLKYRFDTLLDEPDYYDMEFDIV